MNTVDNNIMPFAILVVEDEAMLRKNLCMLLGILDHNVLEAATGAEALTIYEEKQAEIGIVVTDMVMPTMGGLELCRKLRELDDQVKIIMMSGYSEDVNLKEIEALNVSAYLQKPMAVEDLIQIIERLSPRIENSGLAS